MGVGVRLGGVEVGRRIRVRRVGRRMGVVGLGMGVIGTRMMTTTETMRQMILRGALQEELAAAQALATKTAMATVLVLRIRLVLLNSRMVALDQLKAAVDQ